MKRFKNLRKVLIIAEAGVNHNGSEKIAYKLIDQAKKCGADIVKFQIFNATNLSTKTLKKPNYIKKNFSLKRKSQFEILKKLELRLHQMNKISNYCKKKKIEFLLSPFDIQSIINLKKLNLKRVKIPSGEINNYPYLKEIAKLNKKIILSTGMSFMHEIKDAINTLTLNGIKKKKITILHCTTDYPTSFKDVNLDAINSIKKHFNLQVGYSDHTTGIEVPIAAVANGATVIEKHFTLNKKMIGPDHKASLEPEEFKNMVKCIRNIEKAIGNGVKKPAKSEIKNRKLVRKSIVASEEIIIGQKFSTNNLTTKRPGSGISPMSWKKLIGKKSKKNYKVDDLIKIQ